MSAATNRLSYLVEVRNSLLGTDATVMGIERLAIQAALAAPLGETACPLPSAWFPRSCRKGLTCASASSSGKLPDV